MNSEIVILPHNKQPRRYNHLAYWKTKNTVLIVVIFLQSGKMSLSLLVLTGCYVHLMN